MSELYARHGEIVDKYFRGNKLSVHEIVELAHIRKELNIKQMHEMFGEILDKIADDGEAGIEYP